MRYCGLQAQETTLYRHLQYHSLLWSCPKKCKRVMNTVQWNPYEFFGLLSPTDGRSFFSSGSCWYFYHHQNLKMSHPCSGKAKNRRFKWWIRRCLRAESRIRPALNLVCGVHLTKTILFTICIIHLYRHRYTSVYERLI